MYSLCVNKSTTRLTKFTLTKQRRRMQNCHVSDGILLTADSRLSVPNARQWMNIQQVLCLLSLQWITVTCWTAVQKTNQWHQVKNVSTPPLTSPCWRPTPSSHRCRSLQAWAAWRSSQRGCPCSTLMSSSRWDSKAATDTGIYIKDHQITGGQVGPK